MNLANRFRRSAAPTKSRDKDIAKSQQGKRSRKSTSDDPRRLDDPHFIPPDESGDHGAAAEPPAYDHDDGTIAALPITRISESSRSDAGSGDPAVYASTTTTTTHTVHTITTTLFRLPRRRNKAGESLFPLGHLPQKGNAPAGHMSQSTISASSLAIPRPSFGTSESGAPFSEPGTPRASTSHSGTTPNVSSPEARTKHATSPATALWRPEPAHSGRSSPTRGPISLRGRSSTMSSIGGHSNDECLAPPTIRTSSSTGRKSFSDLFGLSRLRQNSDLALNRHGSMTPVTPGSATSKNNSLQLVREEQVVLPERRDDDTPAKYLARLEEVVSRSVIPSALSRGSDQFSTAVMRSYMRSFRFFGDPIDMALRKLLMEAELPRETQQIDRCLQAFANRYDECNPGVYSNPDQAYFIAFSLLILHTDAFNKNNKRKMQKHDYLKNAGGEGIFDEILECFYDNITYTPFIHVEDDLDINGERIVAHKARRKPIFAGGATEVVKTSTKEPLDPYTLIIDGKLDVLRPSLKDVMHLEDQYSYLGTAKSLDLKELQKTFFRTGVLQIVSARSRPDAFMTEKTATNPEEAHPGIVDIKITKVGLLWRKDAKKKRTRSKWQEWGAILTGAQLYFFRNTTWVKSLMHQYESHVKQGNDGVPVIFQPPLEQFKPDVLFSTDGAVALVDSTYKRHKNAFVYVRHGGIEEVLLADDENEMNDWLAKLNYAAAFRTSGVRMRGVVGGHYDGQSRRGIRRLDSSDATQLIQTPTGDVSIARGRIDQKMAEDILAARRDIMVQKVADAADKLASVEKQLEAQLRNARHLQILAPIQTKTREQVLLAAARMSAQLKWTRMEIWKLRCHRDILLQDLEEERNGMEYMASTAVNTPPMEAPPQPVSASPGLSTDSTVRLGNEASRPSGSVVHDDSECPERPNNPTTDAPLQTPPKTSTRPRRRSDTASLRAGSISSSIAFPSPQPPVIPSGKPPNGNGELPSGQPRGGSIHDDIDDGERDLLEQAGLIKTRSRRVSDSYGSPFTAGPMGEAEEWRDNSSPAEKVERNKLRRSLQRTLRDSAGHLSHQRIKKGKEILASGSLEDDNVDSKLTRSTGSFVVHGKKASVINFGTELRAISPDAKIRAKQQVWRDDQSQQQQQGQRSLPRTSGEHDFYSVTEDGREWSERRGSAASASTATARSFRELHRKYSRSASAGRLTAPSDEDSEVALSFSEGRRTPLPPIERDVSECEDDPVTNAAQHHSQHETPSLGPTTPTSENSGVDH